VTTYRAILQQAWPAILASAAVPLLGFVDTAIVSYVGGDVDLGAVALSTLVFNSIYWALGFLRMSTTALVAREYGAGRIDELWRVIARALGLGVALGAALMAVRGPLTRVFLGALDPEGAVAHVATGYVHTRIFGAPAVLVQYAVSGALIGLGRTRALLAIQLLMNAVNVVGNVFFVWGLGGQWRGVQGIAAGTLCAEWAAAVVSVWILLRATDSAPTGRLFAGASSWFWDRVAWRGVLGVNFNIFLRTLALLAGFAWFTRSGSQLGEQTLAGNHLLQQVVSFSAFFLDGVAFVAESLVGQAVGARDRGKFYIAVVRTSLVALGFAAALALAVLVVGPSVVGALAPSRDVLDVALSHVPLAALYVLVGVVPWQLDGIFIGAARGAALRNAAVVSLVVFWGAAVWWTAAYGNTGLWWAMIVYIAMRGITLLLHWRHLTRLFA
jgi:multidrug resistance protein, MATE family